MVTILATQLEPALFSCLLAATRPSIHEPNCILVFLRIVNERNNTIDWIIGTSIAMHIQQSSQSVHTGY
ncbi:hypothetical protein L917_01418 [Phytophthora nicotianae]|uniref:Uncharacterized protein n=1 Tax=Phytophthora nicotianae TaxID=4792 RepID=W2JRM9_PHYNI|nr:hypothetical protein L916_01434 [Phytophthora nicotianae]ETM02058.1 hypothetical protein L917_01418 [Phytophthora nicotianae]